MLDRRKLLRYSGASALCASMGLSSQFSINYLNETISLPNGIYHVGHWLGSDKIGWDNVSTIWEYFTDVSNVYRYKHSILPYRLKYGGRIIIQKLNDVEYNKSENFEAYSDELVHKYTYYTNFNQSKITRYPITIGYRYPFKDIYVDKEIVITL